MNLFNKTVGGGIDNIVCWRISDTTCKINYINMRGRMPTYGLIMET